MAVPSETPVEAVGTWVKTAQQFWKDLTERALNTFWQGALPIVVAAAPATNWSEVKVIGWAAIVGGSGAVLSAAKSLWSRNRGVKNSASADSKV